MTSSSYFRFPHLHGDLVTFVAEDDVWIAPLDGGRAWRVSSLQLPARNPRFTPDGKKLVWTVIQGTAPEVVSADVDGGGYRQLTYFGHSTTRVKGFTAGGAVVVTSAFRQAESRHTHAYSVPLEGGWAEELPFGPVESVAFGPEVGDERPVVVASVLSREPAWWKRYRGGTAGKLWIDTDGNGEFERLLPELEGNFADPLWVDGRVAFLSDHEGYGNLYSVLPNGKDLRRHTDHEDFYVRHAATDGSRVIFESAGELWVLKDLGSEAVRLDITLGSASQSRRPSLLKTSKHLGAAVPDASGSASAVEAHGTIHWLRHKDGPSRIIEATPGVRGRLPRPLGDGRIAYIADHGGVEALHIRDIVPAIGHPASPTGTAPATPPAGDTPEAASPVETDTGSSSGPADAVSLPQPVPAAGAAVLAGSAQPSPVVLANSRPGGSDEQLPDGAPGEGTGEPAGAPAAAQIAVPTPSRASALEASPDGRWLALGTSFGDVYVADAASGELTRVTSIGEGTISDLAWSGDSAWLVWSEPVTSFGSRSRLRAANIAAAGSDPVEVTDGRFCDRSPAFTPDGKYLAFLSNRSFDPVYDGHSFDLSFPSPIKPYLVALAAGTPSPFGPDVAPGATDTGGSDAADAGAPDGPAPVRVDPEGLAHRVIGVPVPQGNYTGLSATKGALLWLDAALSGVTGDGKASQEDKDTRPSLVRYDLGRRKQETLVESLDSYRLSGDRTKAVVIADKQVTVVPSDARADEESGKLVKVDLGRIRVMMDPVSVWGQAFDEAWRLQRDFFWAEDMAGQDWDSMRNRYRPLVDRLGSHDDLVDLLWELHGELGTSHAYVRPAAVTENGSHGQGRLGADLAHTASGWEITRILAGESSDPLATSPLNRPGVDAKAGDILLAIDGVPLAAAVTPAMQLVGAAGRAVELTLLNGAGHGDAAGTQRRVAVVPVKDEERLRYQEWVASNRRTVREASGGAFGYLHIPDMMANGWAQLHRDLDTETALDGLIVDVRRNRGGHTSQLVAELIGRKVTGWSMPRGEKPRTYPHHAPRGPVIILADEFAGSDGDIITQVSKLRGIGPVIGTRTWGGVVGIDNRFALADGTGVTQPRYANWFSGGIGWSVENHGVDPDIEVTFPPHAYAAGRDPQLEYGIGALKEMVQELPTDRPPVRAGYPSLRPGPLPARNQAKA
ncbi:peptidase S41 [Pseudarthrobacter chlorophenolicus A6]|uniref:Peptidase S41 n=1 Tax=Pseudarthrobacter chlorophenolicus (strain ATCC 700700 / DSM 12829 / CIP 107037 / JCM 12360 / KCTC 9906 / NCIMB 13794 / A6) TaxID=452863 RepID=B8HH01_PSECP|nr:S41 family peptidase [Pseudarthrobacter chlorophenolicus]ACL39590.1 peptidase S41 [Pseudarthrobacter chlorophenolicus A6]